MTNQEAALKLDGWVNFILAKCREAKIEALRWVSQDSTVSYEQIEDEIARLEGEKAAIDVAGEGNE